MSDAHERVVARVQLRAATELLRAASSHVFRQQHAGKHEQDRIDAEELLPKVEVFLKQQREGVVVSEKRVELDPQRLAELGKVTKKVLDKKREVHLVINGCQPGWGAKNRKFKGRNVRQLSDEYKTFQDHVWIAWTEVGQPRFETGGVIMKIHVFWGRKRTFEDGFVTGMGDVDAVSSAVLDALEDQKDRKGKVIERRCLDNDMRVVEKLALKSCDPDHPRVEVWLRRV